MIAKLADRPSNAEPIRANGRSRRIHLGTASRPTATARRSASTEPLPRAQAFFTAATSFVERVLRVAEEQTVFGS